MKIKEKTKVLTTNRFVVRTLVLSLKSLLRTLSKLGIRGTIDGNDRRVARSFGIDRS
jgi:hypothetical protein